MADAKPRKVLYALCSDPGTANHGIAVVKGSLSHSNKLSVEVLGNARLPREVLPQNFANPYEDQQTYANAVSTFFKSCVPKHVKLPSLVVAERFQGRGLRGSQGELVSFMLATQTFAFGNKAPIMIITASQWKNQVNQKKTTKDKKLLDELYAKNAAYGTNHQLDASLMGCYALAKALGVPYFTMLRSPANRTTFLGQVRRSARK